MKGHTQGHGVCSFPDFQGSLKFRDPLIDSLEPKHEKKFSQKVYKLIVTFLRKVCFIFCVFILLRKMNDDNHHLDEEQEDYEYSWRWSEKDFKMVMAAISKDSIYSFHSPRRQLFSLPFEVISRIMNQKKSAGFLLKLYQTCKYFFTRHRVLPIIFSSQCDGSLIYSNDKYFNFGQKVLFWFHDTLRFSHTRSSLLPIIYCCTVKKLSFTCVTLTVKEFEMVTLNSLVEHFYVSSSNFVYPNGRNMSLDEILHRLPICTTFFYGNESELFAEETLVKLIESERLNKFKRLSIAVFSLAPFDPTLLCQFIHKNLSPESNCLIDLRDFSHVFITSADVANMKCILKDIRAFFESLRETWNGKTPNIVVRANKRYDIYPNNGNPFDM